MVLITESRLRSMLKTGIPNPYPINENDKLTPAAIDFLRERGVELQQPDSLPDTKSTNDHHSGAFIPVGVSNRHVHLTNEDIEQLFGVGYVLRAYRDLSQPGQYASEEKVTLLGPKGFIQNVRILGPPRGATQVEISKTDGFQLGIHPPVRLSGSIEDTPGLTIIGSEGFVTLTKGAIVAKSHVHMSPADAQLFNVENDDELMLKTSGERTVVFPNVSVRVNNKFVLDFHVDIDEANASSIKTGDTVTVVGKNGKLLFSEGGLEEHHGYKKNG